MSRVRLTNKSRKAADFEDFPGTVNQPDRKDPKMDQYHTFEHTVNHELPDMRTEWKENPRDEVGFGIPKVAHIWATAQKAVKLATLFLGDKVSDKTIEAQARDFMRLGSRRIELALKRFATTEELYKAEDEDEADEEEETVEEAPVEKAAMSDVQKMGEDKKEEKPVEKTEEKPVEKEASKPVETSKVVKAEEVKVVKAEEVKAEDKKEEKTEEKKDEKTCKSDDEKEIEEDEELETAMKSDEAEGDEITDETDEVTADVDENEIDMTPADDDVEMTDEDSKALSSVFADDDTEEEDDEEVVEASKKKTGVKKLGGQPKVASKKSDSLTSIWQDAPDVSHIFN